MAASTKKVTDHGSEIDLEDNESDAKFSCIAPVVIVENTKISSPDGDEQYKDLISQLCCTWVLLSSANFQNLLDKLGVHLKTSKFGNKMKPTITFNLNGDSWEMVCSSALKTHKTEFKLNVEAPQETMYGRKVKTTFTLSGNKMIQTEIDRVKNTLLCVITREINSNGQLVSIAEADNIVATRVYNKCN